MPALSSSECRDVPVSCASSLGALPQLLPQPRPPCLHLTHLCPHAALSAKDQEKFTEMLIKWLLGICAGVPVYVLR